MAMKGTPPPESPDAYVRALSGWRSELVGVLRSNVLAAGEPLEEVIKWGHLVYLAEGPVLLIRAEDHRVLFGFWRGQRLRHIEPRLKPGGKYELATADLRDGDSVDPEVVRRLVVEAAALNRSRGDPATAT